MSPTSIWKAPLHRARSAGQALVEFAIVLPILALLLLGIIQFAFIFAAQIGVTNAVREAARIAAVSPTTTNAQAVSGAQNVYLRLTNTTNGLLKQNVFAFNSANIVTTTTWRGSKPGAPEGPFVANAFGAMTIARSRYPFRAMHARTDSRESASRSIEHRPVINPLLPGTP